MKHDMPKVFGVATVNDKGQIVIPSEARTAVGLQSGMKLLVLEAMAGGGVVLLKTDGIESLAKRANEHFDTMRQKLSEVDAGALAKAVAEPATSSGKN